MSSFTFDIQYVFDNTTRQFVTNACCKEEAFTNFVKALKSKTGMTEESWMVYFDENPNKYKITRRWKR